MELKDTLLLPKTEFSMRGNLGNKEPEIINKWEELKIYEKGLKLNEKNKSLFYMMDLHMPMVQFNRSRFK